MKRSILAIVLVSVFLGAHGAIAQQPTPEPGANAAKMLPDAKWLGKGWKRLELRGVDADANLFREAAVGSYGGPQGSRVIVVVYLQTNSREAIRQSWEAASSVFDNYRYRLSYDYSRDEQLQTIAPPAGCAEVKRTEGEDRDFLVPSAITLCAADPDVIVLAVVAGDVGGVNDYAISDWIASQTVQGKQADIPIEPTPSE